MRFEGVLLKPLDKQRDHDGLLIDPRGVAIPDTEFVIFNNFDYTVPESVLGSGRVQREEDGSLVVVGTLLGKIDRRDKLAIGVRAYQIEKPGVLASCELISVALTETHADPTQPAIREIHMNLVRLGHYHVPTGADDAGYCQTALVVKVWSDELVNLVVWDGNGVPTPRTSVPVSAPQPEKATFHLSGECEWHR